MKRYTDLDLIIEEIKESGIREISVPYLLDWLERRKVVMVEEDNE